MNDDRLNPESLLKSIKTHDETKGKLKIFFGMSAGVGKTYAMLQEANQRLNEGVDIVIGIINTHGRKDTESQAKSLPVIPEKILNYKGTSFKELDIDAILTKKPQVVLIDELAHTNVPGSRHSKRWQDVIEILDAGIDVYSTLNVQHIESRKDVVEEITGIVIRETVPDMIIDRASELEFIDITPDELLKRLKEGKVYLGNQSQIAAKNFFQIDRLTALREIALRLMAEKVDHDLHSLIPHRESLRGWKPSEKLLVAVSHSPHSQKLIRTCRRYAFTFDAPWIALHINNGKKLSEEENEQLSKNLSLARELGAEVITVVDPNINETMQRIATQNNVTQIIIGRPEKRFFRSIFGTSSLIDKLKYENSDIDIHIIRKDSSITSKPRKSFDFEINGTKKEYIWSALFIAFLAIACDLFNPFNYHLSGFIFLFGIILLSTIVNFGPLIFSAFLASIVWGLFFIPPEFNFSTTELGIIASYFFSAGIIGFLSSKVKEYSHLLRLREEKTQALYDTVKEIAKAPNIPSLFESMSLKLNVLLAGRTEFVPTDSRNKLSFQQNSLLTSDEKEKAVASWVLENKKIAGFSTDTLSSAQNLYIPLKGYKQTVGVLVFKPDEMRIIHSEELNLLQTISHQLAVYVEKILTEEKTRKAQYAKQIERVQHAIFNMISISLKNPLKAIEGVTHELQTLTNTENKKFKSRKIQQIEQSTKSLGQIVDNVLTMSLLSSGLFKIKKEKNDIKKLINHCVENLHANLLNHKLDVRINETIEPFLFDFSLMEILLSNLLLNSCVHTPIGKEIVVGASPSLDMVLLYVFDEGETIPKEELSLIFDKNYRSPESKKLDSDLDLTLVKSIADLHTAKIDVRQREGGGMEFVVHLPIS